MVFARSLEPKNRCQTNGISVVSARACHYHANAIANVVAHLTSKAASHGFIVDQYCRESSLAIGQQPNRVYPDGAFRVVHTDNEQPYSFVFELDNGTERVRTKRDIESIERKNPRLRRSPVLIQTPMIHDGTWYLFITTRSERRLRHVLDACSDLIANPMRTLFLGATLEAVEACDPFVDPVFQSNNGLRRTLVPVREPRRVDSLMHLRQQNSQAVNVWQTTDPKYHAGLVDDVRFGLLRFPCRSPDRR